MQDKERQAVDLLAKEILCFFDECVTYKTARMALEKAREMLDEHSTVSLELFPFEEEEKTVKEKWTGELIGKMHNADVTYDDLGNEIGWGKAYVSMILNGQRSPNGAREKLESPKYTDFGLSVKIELLRRGMAQNDLIQEIRERNLFCDSGYLSKIFRGERNAPKVVDAIRDILDLRE